MNRFGNVSVLSPQQFQNQNQNLQQQQQQQQNSFIQQQYMSATQPQLFNNSNTSNLTRSAFSQQPFTTINNNSNPISNLSSSNFNNGAINSMNNLLLNNSNSVVNSSLTSRNTNSGQPQWFNNSKKRSIPQNIVKRSSFKRVVNSTAKNSNPLNPLSKKNDDFSSDDGFDTISFGSKKNVSFHKDNNMNTSTGINGSTSNNTLNPDNLLNDSTDAPPMVSLNDWKREEEFNSTSINNKTNTNVPLFTLRSSNNNNNNNTNKPLNNSSHMSHVNNAFDKDSKLTSKNNSSSSFNMTPNQRQNNNSSNKNADASTDPTTTSASASSQLNQEFAVIVFGYPESVSNLIITHFSKFGNILEDFQVLRSSTGINKFNPKNTGKKYPIFTGDGWIKLTYDSQASAIRALQENGKVITGCILGVLPYNKEIVEQLASCKISKSENIGENGITPSISPITDNASIHTPMTSNMENGVIDITNPDQNKKNSNSSVKTNSITQSSNFLSNHKLTIKDGKSLFIHNTNANNHNFLQNLERKMREQEQLSQNKYNSIKGGTVSSKNQSNSLLHSVNNWLFGWNNL